MKSLTNFLLLLFLAGCNQSGTLKKDSNAIADTFSSNKSTDTLPQEPEILKIREEIGTTINRKVDTAFLMNIAEEILRLIKNRDYRKFTMFIHPPDHIRFSPYSYIDTINDRTFSADQFLQLAKQNKKVDWNSAWEEKPELLTIEEYFKKFVYDVDFLNAELKSINQYHSQGTERNNINEIYPGCNVVEFFFSGFEKKYEGHDFRALRLVFKIKNIKTSLVGVVHDKWRP